MQNSRTLNETMPFNLIGKNNLIYIAKRLHFVLLISCFFKAVNAQEIMETGGHKMPNEWIDKDTKHKVVRLSRIDGSNLSFYFHNIPFIGN